MDNSRIVFLINDQARCMEAKYEETGNAEVFKTMDQSIKNDDLVVVQSGTRHGMTVAKISRADIDVNFDSSAPIKWIVQRIDRASFENILASEGEAVAAVQAAELRRKKVELRKTMFADHEDSIAKLALTDRAIDGLAE